MAVSALIDEATRRSAVVWLALDDAAPRPVWFLWHLDCLWLVCGGAEQLIDASAEHAEVIVRSRASQSGQVVVWQGAVARVEAGSAEWDEVIPLLHERRLNAVDGEGQPERWARESVVLRVTPEPSG